MVTVLVVVVVVVVELEASKVKTIRIFEVSPETEMGNPVVTLMTTMDTIGVNKVSFTMRVKDEETIKFPAEEIVSAGIET